MSNTTLKDVADALKISVTTVSKALKGYKDVSPSTREAVFKMVEKLNYTPNVLAVNLRTQETKIIGVVVPTIVHQFFTKVIEGIIETAEKNGYMVITVQSNEKFELEKKQLDLLQQKRVDGILISLSNETYQFDHLDKVLKNGTPMVMFDKISRISKCSKVVIDDLDAAYDAVSYLIKKGYKKIAHFRGSLTPQNSIDRFKGYKMALENHGIGFDPSLVYLCDNNDDFTDGYINAKKLLTEHKDVDAIFTITDVTAVGIYKCFKEYNVKIPDDIAVFGFSNWFISSVVSPALSSVKQPEFEMGIKATELLIEEIQCKKESKHFTYKNVVLPTSLIIREST